MASALNLGVKVAPPCIAMEGVVKALIEELEDMQADTR